MNDSVFTEPRLIQTWYELESHIIRRIFECFLIKILDCRIISLISGPVSYRVYVLQLGLILGRLDPTRLGLIFGRLDSTCRGLILGRLDRTDLGLILRRFYRTLLGVILGRLDSILLGLIPGILDLTRLGLILGSKWLILGRRNVNQFDIFLQNVPVAFLNKLSLSQVL